jgi:hypothetical protein
MLNQVLCFFRDFTPFIAVKIEFALLDHRKDFLVIITIERRVATQQDIQYAPSRPKIALNAIIACQYLRRDVIGRPCSSGHRLQLLRILACTCTQSRLTIYRCTLNNFTKSKINNLQIRIVLLCFKQKVLRLEISVCNILAVTVAQRLKYLFKDSSGHFLREELLFNNPVKKFTSFAHFCDQIHIFFVFKVFVKF